MTGRAILRLSPIAVVLVAAACGGAGTRPATVTQTVQRPARGAALYFLLDGRLAPVFRLLPGISRSDLMAALEAGPTASERSAGFSSDIGAGPGSRARLAQIVYTFTQFDPAASVTVDGRSYSRADFEDETPIILVESPLPFARVTSPLRVTGTADTFEATFDYDLVGADGKVLARHFVTATSGNGVRGTFAFTARFTVPHEEQGKLVVYELSAKDGSRIHQSEIPLTLEP